MAFIEKKVRKKGTVYRVHYPDPLTGQRFCKTFDRWKEAKAFKDSPKVTGRSGEKKRTVAGALDHWISVCKEKGRSGRSPIRKATLHQYKKHAKAIKGTVISVNDSKIEIADVLLEKLSEDHCDALRTAMLERWSDKYAAKLLTSFKSALKQARTGKSKLMHHDPAEDVFIRVAKPAPTMDLEGDDKVFEIAEVAKLLDTMKKRTRIGNRKLRRQLRRYNMMVETLVYSGIRPGEMLGVSWPHVRFDLGGIYVAQDIDEDGTIDELKTRAAYRFIEMPDHYMSKLKWWKKLCPQSGDGLVFPTQSGKPQFLSNFNQRGWKPLLLEAKLVNAGGGHKYPPKGLRHARTSLEIREEGASPKDVQKMMGHASIKTTYDIYGHLFDADNERRRSRANAVAQHLQGKQRPSAAVQMS